MDIASNKIIAEHAFDTPQPIPAPSWSPDGSKILFIEFTGSAYQLKVWDLNTGEEVIPKALLSKNIHGQQWNSEGTRILHFVHPVEEERSWREAKRALYWVDPSGKEEPELYIPSIGQSYHKALSVDGRLAAFYPNGPQQKNLLTIHSSVGVNEYYLDPTSEIGQLTWAGDASLLMSVRRKGEEFYGIEEVNLFDGSTSRIAEGQWDFSAAAYMSGRRLLRHVVNVDGLRRTRVCPLPVVQNCHWIGPEGVSASVLATLPDRDSAFVLIAGPNAPPSLHLTDLKTGESTPILTPDKKYGVPRPGGVPLNVVSEDGYRIPAYYWKAASIPGRAPAALIHVPGGPGLQGVPLWEPYISYLTGRGIDVVYMNYRGQTGYGASYEQAPGDLPARAREVLAVRQNILDEIGISEDRLILYGHSFGAPIVMYAAALERLTSPLLLASATPLNATGLKPYDRCVVAFHGDSDTIVPPSVAVQTYRSLFGERALDEPCGHFQIVPAEGHVFEAASSYARVFAAAVEMVE